MPDISTITLYNGRTYNIKDAVARSITAGAIRVVGKTTTLIMDDSMVNPITINGESYTAMINDAVFYGRKEFVFDGAKWHEFGDMTGLGSLATKNSASGKYTPEGVIPALDFIGEETTSSGRFTPSGRVSADVDAGGNYQPTGTVSTPDIKVKTPGSTTMVRSVSDVGTLPQLTIDVDEETENMLITFDRGTLPQLDDGVRVKTGDAAYESTQPTFAGTKVQLKFTGTEGNMTVSGIPQGSVSQPEFIGTEKTVTVS